MGRLDRGGCLQASSWPDSSTFSHLQQRFTSQLTPDSSGKSLQQLWGSLCWKQPRDMCLLAQDCSRCAAACFSGKGFLQHERSAGKQRALGREVTGSSWSQWVTCRVTEQLGSSLLCFYFGNINKHKRPDQSLRAPTQTLRSPVDMGGTSSLRHGLVHKNPASFGLWEN